MGLVAPTVAALLVVAFVRCVLGITVADDAAPLEHHSTATRGEQCQPSCPVWQGWRCAWWAKPLHSPYPTPAHVDECLKDLLRSVPQPLALEAMQGRLLGKARRLLFVGDSGVGKTHVARITSVILSSCPGGGLDGSFGTAAFVVECSTDMLRPEHLPLMRDKMIAHMKLHPNAVFVIDDVDMLDEAALELLAPLVSGTQYPDSDVTFDTATVVMTIGSSALSPAERAALDKVTAATRERLSPWPHIASSAIAKHAEIVQFLPFGMDEHRAVIRHLLNELPCRHPLIASVTFTSREVDVLARQALARPYGPNGRAAKAVVRALANEIAVKQAAEAQALQGVRTQALPSALPLAAVRLSADADNSIVVGLGV